MKSRALKSWCVGVLGFFLVPLSGCGAAEAEGPGAASPVGYDQEPGPYAPTPGSPEERAQEGAGAPPPAPASDPDGAADDGAPQPAPGDLAIGADDSAYTDTDPSALSDFRPALDPYGTWSEDPTYGTVWSPSAGAVGDDFAPYVSSGHWAYDDDYTWVSDYSWGWAPFHYGRWVYIGGRGWSWIPGRSYAGAWVTWRYGGPDYGYVGWAPLPPTWYWHRGVAVGIGFVPPAPYVFCGTRDVFAPGVRGRLVGGSQVAVIAGRTRPYVPSGAVVAGHVSARPGVAGPSPAMMNVPAAAVAHAGGANVGVARAQAYARPSSAVPMGARAPSATFRGGAVAGNNPGNPAYAGRTAYASPSVRAAGNAAVASGPQYRGVAPTHFASPSYASPQVAAPSYRSPQVSPSYAVPRAAPTFSAPRSTAPVFAAPRAASPSFSAPRSSPSFAAPRVASPPSMSRPSFAAPAVRAGGGGGHGGHR